VELRENKIVLSCRLKVERYDSYLVCCRSWFHSAGPEYENARSPDPNRPTEGNLRKIFF